MNRHNLIILTLLTINFLILSCTRKTRNESLPNIVYILADDLGYGDVSAFNSHSRIETPAIDKLAREGMMFS